MDKQQNLNNATEKSHSPNDTIDESHSHNEDEHGPVFFSIPLLDPKDIQILIKALDKASMVNSPIAKAVTEKVIQLNNEKANIEGAAKFARDMFFGDKD